MKILVANTLYLGDVILSLPMIQRLKEKLPDATIDVLVGREPKDVLLNEPAVNSIIVYDKSGEAKGIAGIVSTAKHVRQGHYDLAIVLPGSVRTALAVYLARIPRRIGTDQSTGIDLLIKKVKFPQEAWRIPGGRIIRSIEKLWHIIGGKHSFVSSFYTDIVKLDASRHAIDRNLQLLEPLGVHSSINGSYVSLCPAARDFKAADEVLAGSSNQMVIAVAPGSSWNTKRWPVENYIEVIKSLIREEIRVVLIGGVNDETVCRDIANAVHSKLLENVCGRFSVLESAALLRNCKLLLTNDSAAMHIGAAMGIPSVIIMGPTVPEFGFAPMHSQHTILEVSGLWCRPCTPFGGTRCPTGTFDCMMNITTDRVFEAVMKRIR